MGLIRFAIENPVKMAVGVILIVLFGMLSVLRIPIQLTPDVDRPYINVTTIWPGASPEEVESEIIDRQEEKLKSVTNVRKMSSVAREGGATVTLEFPVGVDRDVAFRDVSDKLRQVTGYPDRVEEPTVSATSPHEEEAIAWMIIYAMEGSRENITELKTWVEEKIKPQLERAEGVERVDVYGGLDREIQVEVDPYRLAARGITYSQLAVALRGQNRNISAGTVSTGKRDYVFRTVGEYRDTSEIADTVVAYQAGGPVFVRDVAEVHDGFAKQYAFVRSLGEYVIAMPARRESGTNVIVAMESLQKQIELVNRDYLEPRGLRLVQVYDQTDYIRTAIGLVVQNIFVGGALAIIVLMVFLRSTSATGIIAVAIPISVIGTFLVVTMLGRNLNVIMLAGMAFAVGMVVDNAIVVLENIYRHRSMGKTKLAAALDGAQEVWGAILASTLTTIAVFIPVIFIQEEAGQLFRDIAIAISAAVALSLIVAVLVIPPLGSRFFHAGSAVRQGGGKPWWLGGFVSRIVAAMNRSVLARVVVIVAMTGLSLGGSKLLAPATEYLPAGNQNLVFGRLFSPPGYSIEEFKRMALLVEEGDPNDPLDGIRAFWEAQPGTPEAEALPPVDIPIGKSGEIVRSVKPAPIKNFFFVGFGGMAFMGATSHDDTVVKPLEYVMGRAGQRIPGVFSMFSQESLFRGGAGGNTVDVEIRGDDQDAVVAAAGAILGSVMQAGYGYPSPDPPNFSLGQPEIQIVPSRTKAADLGMSVVDVGFVLEAFIKGAYVGEFNDKGDKIDMVIKVKNTEHASPRDIGQIPIGTPTGKVVPLASVVDMTRTTAPQQINHIEEMNSVTLSINPKAGVPLQATMDELDNEIIGPLRTSGAIPPTIITTLAGTADKLTQTQRALIGDFRGTVVRPRIFGLGVGWSMAILVLAASAAAAGASVVLGRSWGIKTSGVLLAVLIVGFLAANPLFLLMVMQSRMVLALLVTYLLMAALFESFTYPFVIMFSVPLAAVGGFLGLRIVHEISLYDVASPIQQLDVLTMLGFVILIGIVVNNAILLVHQALVNMRELGMDSHEAVAHSVATRTRPIMMTALTSIVGMLPLVIMSGAGSELYRGLGSVLVGGLLVSTVFTLVLVPAVFSLFLDVRAWAAAVREPGAARAQQAPAVQPAAPSATAASASAAVPPGSVQPARGTNV